MHGDTLDTDETGMESQKESGKTKRKKSPFAVWLHRQSDAFLSLSLVHHSREEWMSKRGHESNLRKGMEKSEHGIRIVAMLTPPVSQGVRNGAAWSLGGRALVGPAGRSLGGLIPVRVIGQGAFS